MQSLEKSVDIFPKI